MLSASDGRSSILLRTLPVFSSSHAPHPVAVPARWTEPLTSSRCLGPTWRPLPILASLFLSLFVQGGLGGSRQTEV